MRKDTVIELTKPGAIAGEPILEVLRRWAKEMLKCGLKAEVEEFLARSNEVRNSSG